MRKPAFLVPVPAGGALLLGGCGSDDGGGATGAASFPAAAPGY